MTFVPLTVTYPPSESWMWYGRSSNHVCSLRDIKLTSGSKSCHITILTLLCSHRVKFHTIPPHQFCIPLLVLVGLTGHQHSVLLHCTELFPIMCGCQQLEAWNDCRFALSLSLSLSYSPCPLGIPLTEAPGSMDQGSLPASRSVCTLGRDGPAP